MPKQPTAPCNAHAAGRPGRRHAWRIYGLVLIWLGGAGCLRPQPPAPMPPAPSLDEALAVYNGNVRAVGPFSAEITAWEALLYEGERRHSIREAGGKLFYSPPGEGQERASLSLRASASFYDLKALILGSNAEEYWMVVTPQKYGMWGRYRNLDNGCGDRLPLEPQAILDLAGLKPIPGRTGWAPHPVYKVLAEQYAIEYVQPAEEGLWLQREIRIDRRTGRPAQVALYDRQGHCLGRSELSDYEACGDGMVPGRIRLVFVDEQGRDNSFQLRLRRPRPLTTIHPLLFERPLEPAGLETYQQIDLDCEESL